MILLRDCRLSRAHTHSLTPTALPLLEASSFIYRTASSSLTCIKSCSSYSALLSPSLIRSFEGMADGPRGEHPICTPAFFLEASNHTPAPTRARLGLHPKSLTSPYILDSCASRVMVHRSTMEISLRPRQSSILRV